ncbi:MAG: hypothetical protein HUU55_18515 [Myxococcales bacterium]|nr:hypothetical protein [Myxococcales bacterium]
MTTLEETTTSFIFIKEHTQKVWRSDGITAYTSEEYTACSVTGYVQHRYVQKRETHDGYTDGAKVIENDPEEIFARLRRLDSR